MIRIDTKNIHNSRINLKNKMFYRGFGVISGVLLVFCLFGADFSEGARNAISQISVLHIDGGMHTSVVRRIAVDQNGRMLASVSEDKTLRLWSLPSGRLWKTIRVPIEVGNEGKLYAVAVSANGKMAAIAGFTGQDWEDSFSIYVVDTSTGKMRFRIKKLPFIVNHLAFSADGLFLSAMLGESGALYVFRARDGREVAMDRGYKGSGSWSDFSSSGKLVTASFDGFIRLYDSTFKLLVKRKFAKHAKPYSAQFSPDGRTVAVGFLNQARVAVLSSTGLDPLYFPDVTGVNGDLRTVAWSADGHSLFAAGNYGNGQQRLIRWWSNQGRDGREGKGEYVDLPASKGTIMHLLANPTGGVLFSSADPAIGLLDQQGFRVFMRTQPSVNFIGSRDKLLVSKDGSMVQFPYDVSGGRGRFSAKSLELTLNPTSSSGLKPPLTQLADFNFSRDKKGEVLMFNGTRLLLEKGEKPKSLAIASDGRFFVMGTSYYLRLYDRFGRIRWQVSTPTVWGVNVAESGRVIVAALGDGTIRWYSVSMGKEVLSLFPHNDKRRWVVWTPDKFYAASFSADDLIGWHKNQGKESSAEFYPVSRFREAFNRPQRIKLLFR